MAPSVAVSVVASRVGRDEGVVEEDGVHDVYLVRGEVVGSEVSPCGFVGLVQGDDVQSS